MTRALLFLLPLTVLVACGDKDEDTGAGEYDSILSLTGDSTAGEDVYLSTCSGCHGADGTGASGPDLTGHVPAHSDEDILGVVINGEGSMPGFSSKTDQEYADLLAYLRSTFG